MKEPKKIKGILPDGTLKEYDVILTFHNPRTEKDYVIYSDNCDTDEQLHVFAAIYDADAPDPFLGYPATPEEWQDIKQLLDHCFDGQ